ncbi:hypothetical protein [Tianweitania sediminis]|nr:hypothetical protein [Tianweitania sediminis]
MMFGQPGDGTAEKIGTLLGVMVVLLVIGIFAVILQPMLNVF